MDQVIIDVREPEEYATDHVAIARNVPLSELMNDPTGALQGVAKDADIILYCNSGNRASLAAAVLHNAGFTHVTNGINQQQVEATLGQ